MSDYSEWAEQAYADFVKLGRDTVPEKIKENRDKFLPHCSKARKLKKVKDHEVFRLCDEWEHYFDPGYRPSMSIDYLPDKLKSALLDMIEEG